MAETDCLEPQDSQVINEIRVSFVRSVSGDLHVLHVTYSTIKHPKKSTIARLHEGHWDQLEMNAPMYLLRRVSICFCWNLPLMTKRPLPSTLPVVPISTSRKEITCAGSRCIRLHISPIFANTDFLFPSRWMDGGASVYRFEEEEAREGFCA